MNVDRRLRLGVMLFLLFDFSEQAYLHGKVHFCLGVKPIIIAIFDI